MGAPKLGQAVFNSAATKRENAIADVGGPQAEVLGVVNPSITDPTPKSGGAMWKSESGEDMEMLTPPPPWEVGQGEDDSDARRFVDVPNDWTLRWINPRLLDSQGWRYWQSVTASDPRVTVKVKQMQGADNLIRRGGLTGDILAWMYTTWVESRRKIRVQKAAELAGSAVAKQQQLTEEFKRGTFGPYLQFDSAKHPTHTIGDGRTMRD